MPFNLWKVHTQSTSSVLNIHLNAILKWLIEHNIFLGKIFAKILSRFIKI